MGKHREKSAVCRLRMPEATRRRQRPRADPPEHSQKTQYPARVDLSLLTLRPVNNTFLLLEVPGFRYFLQTAPGNTETTSQGYCED